VPCVGNEYEILLGVPGNRIVIYSHLPFYGVIQTGGHFFNVSIVLVLLEELKKSKFVSKEVGTQSRRMVGVRHAWVRSLGVT
jgi:hypothetical protein